MIYFLASRDRLQITAVQSSSDTLVHFPNDNNNSSYII